MDFSESCPPNGAEKEAGQLLEQGWFFGNFLDTKSKTLYSSDQPCPNSTHSNSNSNSTQEMLVKKSKNKSSSHDQSPSMASPRRFPQENERWKSTSSSLARAPSLPPCMNMERDQEDEDQESEFTMGRLIRQASLGSDSASPCAVYKGTSMATRQQARKKMMHTNRRSKKAMNEEKRPNDDESELGFSYEDEKQLGEMRRKLRVSSPPRIPAAAAAGCVDAEDIKAQIKFWARAVASNVRQEC